MNPSTLFVTDLDETLIYHHRGTPPAGVSVVSSSPDPRLPDSVMTDAAVRLLREVAFRCLVVPVTARSVEAFRRVGLPWTPSFAIAGNGAALLVDGDVDPVWDARTQALRETAGDPEPLASVLRECPGVVRDRVTASGLLVADVHDASALAEGLAELRATALSAGWYVSVQHQKVHLVPPHLRKEDAVAEVLERTGATTLLAAGDSAMDRGMLSMADRAWRPQHGELHDEGWLPDNVSEAEGVGYRSAETILADVLNQLPHAGRGPA